MLLCRIGKQRERDMRNNIMVVILLLRSVGISCSMTWDVQEREENWLRGPSLAPPSTRRLPRVERPALVGCVSGLGLG